MMKKIKQYVLALAILLGPGLILAPAAVSYAATPVSTACSALGSSSCQDTSGGPGLNKIITSVINLLSLLIGIIAVIMVIVGGLRYVTSNGDSNSLTSARNTVIYALIGLLIAAMAQMLVQFVLKRIS